MKKLIQENGPAHIWLQTWADDGSGDYSPAEPAVFQATDDWTGQLFNYYFLSHFSDNQRGNADVNHPGYGDLKTGLDAFFLEKEMTKIHALLTGKWLEASAVCDEDAVWFTAAWDSFRTDDYEGPALGFYFGREKGNMLGFSGGEPLVFHGLPLKKPEYGCLILPDPAEGYQLYILEPSKADGSRTAWSAQVFPFLLQTDDAFHARQFFKMVKDFSEDVLVKEQHQPREKQISFLSESLDFAKENQGVSIPDFKKEVLREPSFIDAFEDYQEKYSGERQWNPPDQFAMTDKMQDQAKKFVRSVIKLDKNFHLYVHGRRDRLEQGYDQEKKMKYYKLWYEAES